jgi:hypothetical protein
MEEKTPVSNSMPEDPDILVVQQEPVHGDVALGYLLKGAASGEGDLIIDKATTARVLRKIDLVILPIMA